MNRFTDTPEIYRTLTVPIGAQAGVRNGGIDMTDLRVAVKTAASLIAIVAVALGGNAWAGDGRIQINQARALAGSITASDTPGFPVTIDTRGSYVLTGNLTVAASGTTAIHVTQTQVSIDLNGFVIDGPSGCTGAGSTISCTPSGGYGIDGDSSYLSVRNGVITGFGSGGILVSTSDGARIEDITAEANGGRGIDIDDHGVIHNCVTARNGGHGIQARSGTVVTNSVSADNLSDGIFLNGSGSVIGSTAWRNGDDGIVMTMGAVTDSVAFNNKGNGIEATGDSLVRGNAARANTDHGLYVGTTSGAGAAYIHNNFDVNGTTVGGTSAVQMGTNICNGNTTCP
jgi:hypothetical protein